MPDGNEQFRVREQITDICRPRLMDPFNPNLGYNLTQHSCAFARVQLVRHVGYYIMRYYTPTALLVFMVFIQMWTPTVCAPGRAILTGVVEMTLKSVSITAYGETTSRHVTSLFWWQWGCQFFIYVSEMEYALIFGWAHLIVDKHHARKNNYVCTNFILMNFKFIFFSFIHFFFLSDCRQVRMAIILAKIIGSKNLVQP